MTRWPQCSAREFAELFGVSHQAVSEWIDAGMPCRRKKAGKGSRVTIDPKLAAPWVFSRRQPKGSERERLAKEQADKFAIENARARGEIVLVGQIAEVFSILGAELAARHDAVPGRVASEFAGTTDAAVIRQRLLDELRDVRAAVGDAVTKLAESFGAADDDGADPEAPAEPQRERVGRSKPRAPARKRRARKVS
jgi:phage terminase Nu1 subunit (DNA packaging protein)